MYKISQSALKEFEEQDNCPFRWNELHITKSIRSKDFPAAASGKYFEYLCLGTDTGCTELPKLKNGNDSVEVTRIKAQAEKFKAFHDNDSELFKGFVIVDRDIVLQNENSKGIIDYLIEDKDGNQIFMDLKMVADLYRGYYQYGNHDTADYTQQIFYKRLVNSVGYPNADVGLLIFEKGALLRVKEISPIKISNEALLSLDFRINAAYEAIDYYDRNEWTKYPSKDECKGCPIQCEKAYKHEEITIEELKTSQEIKFESIKIVI